LDGLHSSSFINTSGGQTINGGLTVASGLGVTGDLSAGRVLSNGQVVAQNPIGSGNGTSGGLALKTDDSRGVAYLQVVNQAYNAQYGYMAFDTSGGVSWNGNAMIHAGNISSYLTSYTPRIVKLLDVTDTGGTLFSVNVAGYSMVRVLYNITNPSNNWAIGLYFYFNDTSSSSSFWYHSLDVSGTAVTANSWDSQNWGRVGSCSQYGNSSAGFADISLNKYHAYTAYCTENNRLIWGTCNSFDTVTTFNFLLSDIGLGNGHIEIWGMK
jgi:hypothetical protein